MSQRSLSSLFLPLTTLSALAAAGYETVSDLSNSTPELLSADLNIPLPASQAIFSATRPSAALPMTQSAAAMIGVTKFYSTACPTLDRLLRGGLRRGSVLEINGPPGSGKEHIAVNAVKSFVDDKQAVLFVDMQNMVPPATIKRILSRSPTAPAGGLDLVHYQTLHTPVELVVFLQNLPAYLDAYPSTGLLVLNSLTFPIQFEFKRDALLERLKQTLARACASMNLTVIITSHLQSKPLDGSGTGSPKWIMIPTCSHSDFPEGRTYRVMIVPQWKTSGVMRLIYSPHMPKDTPASQVPEESYQRIGGVIQ